MKKRPTAILFLLALALLAAAFMGCAKEEEPAPVLDITGEAAEGEGAQGGEAATASSGAKVEVGKTAAWTFDGTLYGAAEVTNTGNTNVILTEATFKFGLPDGERKETFIPVLAEHDVLKPGQTGYCTLFLPVEGLTPGQTPTLTAEVACAKTDEEPLALKVSDAYLVSNYPNFATLSGALENPQTAEESCSLNMVQAGFYDESGEFLGAWYFSRNAVLAPGVQKPFVVHLKALPIPELADRCKEIKTRAFGV